jgi:outer membrane receptor for ferrienterochelin and colicin
MEALSRVGRNRRHLWFFGSLALLSFTACATTRSADVPSPANDSVDIGYGAVDKDQVTGSVTTVEGEDEATSHTRTLAEMLSRVPGVQVSEGLGGALRVRVRGNSSFMASQDPLFVIDGVQMPSAEGVLRTIDPNHIELRPSTESAAPTA